MTPRVTKTTIINQLQRMTCPSCKGLYEFGQTIRDYALPVYLICPDCNYTYLLDHEAAEQFPPLGKSDPRVPKAGDWRVEPIIAGTPASELNKATDAHQQIKKTIQEQVASLPPELQMMSFPDACKEIQALGLTQLRMMEILRTRMKDVVEAFVREIEDNRQLYTTLCESFEPRLVQDFLRTPFHWLPVELNDKVVESYSRLIICPKFFMKPFGIPISNAGGFTVQLLCPYVTLGQPVESWLQIYLDYPMQVELEPLDSKIIGNSLPFLYEDVPGTEMTQEHTDRDPAIRMTKDGMDARRWLVRHGCPGWKLIGSLGDEMPVKLEWIIQSFPDWLPAIRKFQSRGRLLFAHPDIETRRTFGQLLPQGFLGKPCIIYDKDAPDVLRVREESQPIKSALMTGNEITRMDWRMALHYPLETFRTLVVEADAEYFAELVPCLYQYPWRLILLTGDPLFDFWEGNLWASTVYGLVNCSFYDVPRFFTPHSWKSKYKPCSEALQEALKKVGFVK